MKTSLNIFTAESVKRIAIPGIQIKIKCYDESGDELKYTFTIQAQMLNIYPHAGVSCVEMGFISYNTLADYLNSAASVKISIK